MGNHQTPIVHHIGVIPGGGVRFEYRRGLGGNHMIRVSGEMAIVKGELNDALKTFPAVQRGSETNNA